MDDMTKRFYCATMPSIARSLEKIAGKIAEEETKTKFLVIRSDNFSDNLTPVAIIKDGRAAMLVNTMEEAETLMKEDVISWFNSNGWTEEIVSDIESIEGLDYRVKMSAYGAELATGDMGDAIRWTILEVS